MKPAEVSRSHWIRYNFYFILEHFLGYHRFKKYFGDKSRQLFLQIRQNLNGSPTGNAEIANLNKDAVKPGAKEIRHLLSEPVVFKQAAADWTCTKKWSLEFFQDNFGDIEVHILDTVGAIDPKNPQKYEKILLRDYIEQLKTGSLKYLKFSSLVQEKMKLQEDLDLNWLKRFETPTSFGRRFYMFIGGAGTITPLHNEFPSVVYVQVSGRKKWIIYSANNRIFLDPRTERRHYFYTNADPTQPEDEKFPLLKYAKKYEVILEPGDVLWFPPFAWHYVENLTHSIGVAYKFSDLPEGFKTSTVLTSLYLMATNPNLISNFFALRFSKNNVDTRSAHS